MSLSRSVFGSLPGVRRRMQAAWTVLTDPFVKLSYAQEGEDLILERIFGVRSDGFYVDVGAHHPKRFSNTYLFYLKKWSGVNIDATPGSMEAFRQTRPRDRNIETAISLQRAPLTFNVYNDPALNSTLCAERRDLGRTQYRVVRQVTVTTSLLAEVLTQAVPPGRTIDFLTVDVEGMDLEVLQSNDWQRFRPTYVLAEEWRSQGNELESGQLVNYMNSKGYESYCRTMNTIFFHDGLSGTPAGPA